MRESRRLAWAATAACAFIAAIAPAAGRARARRHTLDWQPCGDAPNVTCATAEVPLDYDHPHGADASSSSWRKSPRPTGRTRSARCSSTSAAPAAPRWTRFEARGAGLSPALNERFDIVGMDPRGVGQSEPSIDCKVNQETDGIYSQPFTTPDNLDVAALHRQGPALHQALRRAEPTDPAARLDGERGARHRPAAPGARRAASSTTSATRTAPSSARRTRACSRRLPRDGARRSGRRRRLHQRPAAPPERADRRLRARAGALLRRPARPTRPRCRGFGGNDPLRRVRPAGRAGSTRSRSRPPDTRPAPVDGDDVLVGAAVDALHQGSTGRCSPRRWPTPTNGDGSLLRVLADAFYGRNDDGTFDPGSDRYFTIGASEQQLPARRAASTCGRASARGPSTSTTWWNNGYVELNYGLWPFRDRDAFAGPFKVPARRSRRWSWPRPTTRRRRTAARRTSSATSATPAC